MILKNRVIWSNNGVLTELSMVMNNHISGSKIFDVNGSQDYLFLGSDAPFNHRWVEVKVANTASLALGVDYWDGKEWVPVAEVVDETVDATGAKSLSQSGMITWVPDKKKAGWSRDDTKILARMLLPDLARLQFMICSGSDLDTLAQLVLRLN